MGIILIIGIIIIIFMGLGISLPFFGEIMRKDSTKEKIDISSNYLLTIGIILGIILLFIFILK